MIPETVQPVQTELLEAMAALWDDSDTHEETRTKKPLDWNIPDDFDWSRVEQRARAYMAKLPGAIQGGRPRTGSDTTYHAACILVQRFAMTPERAYPILSEWNERCEPPWEPADLMRKLQEADRKETGARGEFLRPLIRETRRGKAQTNGHQQQQPSLSSPPTPSVAAPSAPARTGQTCSFENYRVHSNVENGREVITRIGLSVQTIAAQLQTIAPGWPKRIGQLLFVRRDNNPVWIKNPSSLFAWIGSVLQPIADEAGALRDNAIRWAAGPDKIKESQLFDYLLQTTEEVCAVELYPHEPQMAGHYYLHPDLPTGDGSAINALIDRFSPASEVDRNLILAFFLTLVWGGDTGQRPAFLFTTDGGSRVGCGTGKSTIAQIGSELVGKYVSLFNNEDIGVLLTRLLSPTGMEARVALIDNVKSLRFSWSELESLITSSVISGRQMYVGEGRRPNTLTWVITLNGASLSRDMAQRCVIVKVKTPKYTGNWLKDTRNLINTRRWEIIGDLVSILRRPSPELIVKSRWGSWEADVLSCVGDYEACQDTISDRAADVDDDREEMEAIREGFRQKLLASNKQGGLGPDEAHVFIPSELAADVINEITGERRPVNKAMAFLYALGVPEIRKTRTATVRGCVWRGMNTCLDKPVMLGSSDQAPPMRNETRFNDGHDSLVDGLI